MVKERLSTPVLHEERKPTIYTVLCRFLLTARRISVLFSHRQVPLDVLIVPNTFTRTYIHTYIHEYVRVCMYVQPPLHVFRHDPLHRYLVLSVT
jgi:hypothetical protein